MNKRFIALDSRKYKLPLFFPDATRAVVKSLDSSDIESTKTLGILVNTYHLSHHPGISTIKKLGGIGSYMSWNKTIISDSGGFQIMSIAKKLKSQNSVNDKGVIFQLPGQNKSLFTPEMSIRFQFDLQTDLMVVLDDFTDINASYTKAKETVQRTIKWAKRCKAEYEKRCQKYHLKKRPYLIGVVQGGPYLDLRKECTERLVKIGFDGLGWGGWPIENRKINFATAEVITKYSPKNYLLYGLGIGKPEDIVYLVKNLGWHIFDCVLPSRDARHRRLYIYNEKSIEDIDLNKKDFYINLDIGKSLFAKDYQPVSHACDCLLCKRYSRAYLHHLFKIGDSTAGRLSTIHNLRFYSILMEKLRDILT